MQVTFGSSAANSFSGVALDDISVLGGPCYGDDASCNFEESLCGWSSARSIDGIQASAYWVTHNRLQGRGGPLSDHSTSDGGKISVFCRCSACQMLWLSLWNQRFCGSV